MFHFPDPKDRTPNNPAVLLSSRQVAKIFSGIYKKSSNPEWKTVQDTITTTAKKEGWSRVQFSGKQAILIADLVTN